MLTGIIIEYILLLTVKGGGDMERFTKRLVFVVVLLGFGRYVGSEDMAGAIIAGACAAILASLAVK